MLDYTKAAAKNREIAFSFDVLLRGAEESESGCGSDGGAYIRDIFKAWAKVGVCPEIALGLSMKARSLPGQAKRHTAKAKAKRRWRSFIVRLITRSGQTQLKNCIALGHPFKIGFTVYNQFMYGSSSDAECLCQNKVKKSLVATRLPPSGDMTPERHSG